MDCARWNDSLIDRLYDEISAEDDAALTRHLADCASCRQTLDAYARVRSVLAEDEPAVPRLPRVLVLQRPSRFRVAAIAASILGAALLAGTGAGAGYALGARRQPPAAPVAKANPPTSLDAATEALVRDEVARRFAALSSAGAASSAPAARPAITKAELQAQLDRFERKINDTRAADLDYLLTQIEASEVRTGTRIGKTNEALRTVALASNPYIGSQ